MVLCPTANGVQTTLWEILTSWWSTVIQIVSNVRRKFDETKDDIERCIASADTALSILVPIFCTELEENNKAQSNGVEKPNGSEDNEMQVLISHIVLGYSSFLNRKCSLSWLFLARSGTRLHAVWHNLNRFEFADSSGDSQWG